MQDRIRKILDEHLQVLERLLSDDSQWQIIEAIALEVVKTFRSGHKVLFCGNGGSAADAQHLAAELSGRFFIDRPALFSEALHVNPSFLTAVSNDFGFDQVYSRGVEAMGKPGDLLFALSTSGSSPNVLNAMSKARQLGLTVVGFTGLKGYDMEDLSDFLLVVPSENTPRIQELHLLVGHIICELAESSLFNNQ
jgi:D-sedoheptulose 7-phosphate isomerase